MKKVLVLCLATIVALCSFAQKGKKELKKADAAFENHLYTEAASWYEKAAEQGHAVAQYSLGVCYEYGYGVSQDYNQAVYWCEKAAEQGDADAQYNLGVCYAHGDGVSKDIKKAKYWWKKAAAQGDEFAIGSLERLEEESLEED